MFSKLALQNQVDDSLSQLRSQHRRGSNADPASLRGPYDILVLKVLAPIQDGDPALARISAQAG